MNPFSKIQNQRNLSQLQNQNTPIIFDGGSQWGKFIPDGRPSWLERLVGKGTGVLKGISMGILAFAGLAAIVALLIPFIGFLGHLSEWLCDVVDRMF